jgi:FkbM family methyltransferase
MTLETAIQIIQTHPIEIEEHQRTQGRKPFFKINLYANTIVGSIGHFIRTTGEFDAPVGSVIRAELAKHDLANTIVLDVGGNVGFFTLTCASLGSRVITIEALPFNAALLRKSVNVNGFDNFVTIYNVGVGEIDNGEEKCAIQSQPSNGILVDKEDRMKHRYAGECVNIIKMTTIDAILQNLDTPISVAKVDVEGFELLALKGANMLLASNNAPCVLIIELNPDLYMRHKHPWSSQELCVYMKSFGYIVYNLEGIAYPGNTLDFNNLGGAYLDLVFRTTRKLNHCNQ